MNWYQTYAHQASRYETLTATDQAEQERIRQSLKARIRAAAFRTRDPEAVRLEVWNELQECSLPNRALYQEAYDVLSEFGGICWPCVSSREQLAMLIQWQCSSRTVGRVAVFLAVPDGWETDPRDQEQQWA